MEEKDKLSGDIKMRSPLLSKLDNFFYHYKWHSIIAAFLAVVILICSLQMCGRAEYDLEILYAGPKNLNDTQTILDIEKAFSYVIDDRTGDDTKTVNLVSYWVDESFLDPERENTEGYSDSDLAYFAGTAYRNKETYLDEILAGNLVICLVSPYLFHLVDDEAGFLRVTDVFPQIADYEEQVCVFDEDGAINRFGVVLSKTAFGEMAGLSSLPKDTVLCVRKRAPMKYWFSGKGADAAHEYALDAFRHAMEMGTKEKELDPA